MPIYEDRLYHPIEKVMNCANSSGFIHLVVLTFDVPPPDDWAFVPSLGCWVLLLNIGDFTYPKLLQMARKLNKT